MNSWGRELRFRLINDPRDPWGTPGGPPPEPLQTFSENVKNTKYVLRDAILLPWPSHESGPQSARRARKTSTKSPKHRLTTWLLRDAVNQNVKKSPQPPQDFFRFVVRYLPLHSPGTAPDTPPCTHPLHTPYTHPFGIFDFAFCIFHIFLSKLGIGTLINGFPGPRASFSSDK